jgi:lysine/ornithine N-monooxygenase
LLFDFLLDERIAIVGARQEAAELRFRIVVEHRQQDLALVGRNDRPVIGNELAASRLSETGTGKSRTTSSRACWP